MASEFDLQTLAQLHQADLLAEADARRLTRVIAPRRDEGAPRTRRLQTLLRRLVGAPTFA